VKGTQVPFRGAGGCPPDFLYTLPLLNLRGGVGGGVRLAKSLLYTKAEDYYGKPIFMFRSTHVEGREEFS